VVVWWGNDKHNLCFDGNLGVDMAILQAHIAINFIFKRLIIL
jgi:hypothetical protein